MRRFNECLAILALFAVPLLWLAPARAQNTQIQLLAPSQSANVRTTEPLFKWSTVADATHYKVTVTPEDAPLLKQEKTFRDRDVTSFVLGPDKDQNGNLVRRDARPNERGTYGITLEQKKTYAWSVTALKQEGEKLTPVGTSGTATFSTDYPRTLFGRLGSDERIQVKRSIDLNKEKSSEPATFGFLNTVGKPKEVNTEFAILYAEPLLETSVEARLTSAGANRGDNALRFRLSYNITEVFTRDAAKVSLKYEADEDFDAQKLLGELIYTTSQGNIGKYVPAPPLEFGRVAPDRLPAIQFRWRPYIGIEAGRNLKVAESLEKDSTLLRLLGRLRVELRFNQVARALGLNSVVLFGDNTYRHLPLEDENKNPNYLASGLDFFFTDKVSFGFRYKNGRDAPKFTKAESFGGSLGIRF